MTLSVPYSFVPGAKAKAEEVNANFASILSKIEETNTKIDDQNSKLDQKTNLDLSNINDNGKALFDAKADKTEIDGKWVKSYKALAEGVSLKGTSNLTYNISSYLPADENVYEIFVEGLTDTGASNGDYAPLYLSTNVLNSSVSICRARTRSAAIMNSSGSTIIIVDKQRKIIINRSSTWTGSFHLILHAYRKVR